MSAPIDNANLKLVRDHIAGLSPLLFNMGIWSNDCGTVCCIGGWTEKLLQLDPNLKSYQTGEHLGLDIEQSHELFFLDKYYESKLPEGLSDWRDMPSITQDEAIQVIDNLMATGVVDWASVIGYY